MHGRVAPKRVLATGDRVVRTSPKPGAASTIAALRDRAMVAGVVAGQLGEQLAHIVAQIEMVDDELAQCTGQRLGSAPRWAGDTVRERREQRRRDALGRQRAQLERMRVQTARFADSLRAERARLLLRASELQRRSALVVIPAADAVRPPALPGGDRS